MEGKLPFGFLSGGSSQYFTAAGSTTELSTIARGMREASQMSSDALGNLKASSEDMSFKIDDISSAISYYKKTLREDAQTAEMEKVLWRCGVQGEK